MRFYSFHDIRAAGDCAALATTLYGAKISGGRCAATWRGGDNSEAVSIDREKWYDHVMKRGGGNIELAAFHFNGNIQAAQEYLGDLYNLTPIKVTGPAPAGDSRYDHLIREGYAERARYEYRDAAGDVAHIVVRLEHATRPKEFCQGVPDDRGGMRWSLKGVATILYRIPEIAAESWVLICEGEKSADRMAAMGLPSTTAPMGAGKWQDAYTDALAGKHVAIAPDNDEPGREHAETVARALHGRAASVRIVGPLSAREKGGIDDWLDEAPGRDVDAVLAAIAAAPEWAPTATATAAETSHGPTAAQLADAKAANAIPFRNYISTEQEVEKRGRKVKETVQEPRTHQAMLDDLSRRFLGFPRRVGDRSLFDHDRDTGEIVTLGDSDHLLAWIGRRSKHPVAWGRGDSMVTPRQFLASIEATAYRYESISLTPDWPRRADVYYAHGAIPAPCPDRSRFRAFCNFFLPATPEDACLIAAFVCAPLWYVPGIARPSWIIDSRDGQGSGKTNLVELVAYLYGHAPIKTCKQELGQNFQQIVKRCVSGSGRLARIMLVDNVTGNFESPELSDLITSRDITGIAPYGHGEEVRPNNLTYCLTANSATVGTDLADRSLYIHLRKPQPGPGRESWKSRIQAYVDAHRLEIVSDIIAELSEHAPFDAQPRTRFAEFEVRILQPCCGTPDAYESVLESMESARAESNVEEEQARSISEVFESELFKIGTNGRPAFIRSEVVNSWAGRALREVCEFKGLPIQVVRNLSKIGMLPKVDREFRRIERDNKRERHTGVMWGDNDALETVLLVYRDGEGVVRSKTV